MNEQVILEYADSIATLTIHRPKALNALSREIVDLIDAKLEELAAQQGIRVLIITGEDHFAAGADIADMVERTPEEAKAFLFSDTFLKLEQLGLPTIAAISGYALGGGLELALACDFRIASEDAKVGLPEINLGIMPGAGGTVRLPRLIGEAKAKELIFLGSRLSAQEALDCGLVSKVVPKEELAKEALSLAEKLAEKSATAIKAAKKSISAQSLQQESDLWASLFATKDQKEGMRAFLEKRKPVYQGK